MGLGRHIPTYVISFHLVTAKRVGQGPNSFGSTCARTPAQPLCPNPHVAMAVPVAMEEGEDDFEEEQPLDLPPDLKNLLTAAELGDAHDLSQALGELNVSINDVGEDGDTALHLACLYGHTHCVQILLEAGASIDVKDEDGAIPLHDACAGGYVEIVKALLAAAQGDGDKVKRLLETTDIDGDAPLHHAARGNHGDVVEVLLNYGASPSPRNVQGKTAAELADDTNVQRLLEAAVCQ